MRITMIKDDCIFCKISNGDIPSYCLYEDDSFKVILDIEPSSNGHGLIIPKSHADNLFELSDDDSSKALLVAKKVSPAIKQVLGCDGINILQNNGEAAGQTVNHFHIHIIPRYKNDTVKLGWTQNSLDKEWAEKFVNDVKAAIK